jgi:two-component system phosphate regulon sensor histidine kinase PhoR
MRRRAGGITFATDSVAEAAIDQRRTLWVFPELQAGIRFRGTSVEELAAGRRRRTLAMVAVLDLILLAGAWVTYRNLRREMDLARLKSDFVSTISHELRTPLALIRMYAESLEMGRVKDEARRREYYTTIVGESARLTRLVNNILNFSRMEAGRMPYRFEAAGINEVIEEVVRVWEPHVRAEEIRFEVSCAPGLPPLRIDVEAVTEAVVNLIDNAVKYGGEGKFLRIATAAEGDRVHLSVEDHGIGIATQHLPHIFEMFYRVAGGLVQTTRGSGVGLAIVRHIMNAHGGHVAVTSSPGAGSTFTLVFPAGGAGRGIPRHREATA